MNINVCHILSYVYQERAENNVYFLLKSPLRKNKIIDMKVRQYVESTVMKHLCPNKLGQRILILELSK